jgi:O-antigen/teichoic acid export membrane protein
LTLQLFGIDIYAAVLAGVLTGTAINLALMLLGYNKTQTIGNTARLSADFFIYGGKSFVGTTSSLIYKKIDVLICGALLGVGTLGYYVVAASLRDLSLIIVRAIAGLLGGELADKEVEVSKKKKLRRISFAYSVGLSLAFVLGSIAVFPILIPGLYGVAYREAISPAIILMASTVFLSPGIILIAINNANGSVMSQSLVLLGMALVGLILLYFGAMKFGLPGLAWANVAIAMLICGASGLIERTARLASKK